MKTETIQLGRGLGKLLNKGQSYGFTATYTTPPDESGNMTVFHYHEEVRVIG